MCVGGRGEGGKNAKEEYSSEVGANIFTHSSAPLPLSRVAE